MTAAANAPCPADEHEITPARYGVAGVSRDAWGPSGSELADPSLPPALARGTVDRAAERRADTAWVAEQWRGRGRVLLLGPDGATPVTGGLTLDLAKAEGDTPPAEAVLLGVDGDGAYFAVPSTVPVRGRDLREVGSLLPDRDAGLLTTAVALGAWRRTHSHCPRCGTATALESAGWVGRCPADGSSHFPRTDPAVIMLITSPDGERAVLGRQPNWPPQRFSCLAGFVEPGESAEQAVVRESAEESGLQVRAVQARGSQPWPFPASLMLAFTAVADDDTEPHSADDELETVRWFSRRQAREDVLLPPPVSIANRLLAAWLLSR